MASIFEATAGTKLGMAVPFKSVTQGAGNSSPAKTDPVTVNGLSGTIITSNNVMAAKERNKFVVTNSSVKRGDIVILNHSENDPADSGYNHNSDYVVQACAVTDGQFIIQITHVEQTDASENDTLFINFSILKAVTHS